MKSADDSELEKRYNEMMKPLKVTSEQDTTKKPLKEKTFNPDNIHNSEGVDLDLMLYSLGRKKTKQRKVRECIAYIPFIIVAMCYFFFSTAVHDGYWMNACLKNLFTDQEISYINVEKNFMDVKEAREWWQWVETVAMDQVMFADEHYNEKPFKPEHSRYAQMTNKLVGAVRFRQLRVRNDSCINLLEHFGVPKDDPNYDHGCYPPFHRSALDTRPFGPNNRFTYKKCADFKDGGNGGGVSYYGKTSYNWYYCDGHSEEIPFSMSGEDALDYVHQMMLDKWIDKATRVVFIELFTYNANLNYFVAIKLVTEFTAGGGALPSYQFRVFKLDFLSTSSDYVIFVISLLLPLFVIFHSYIWLKDMYITTISTGGKWYLHFKNIWNILDLLNLILFFASFVLRVLWYVHPDRIQFQMGTEHYPHLDEIALIYNVDQIINAFNIIVTFAKFYKYFSLDARFNLLSLTIQKAFAPLVAVGILLAICVCAFTFAAWILFGNDMIQFRDPITGINTLLRVLIGDADYEDMRRENRAYFAYFFTAYICIASFVIFNMFMAVINDSFGKVKEETRAIDNNVEEARSYISRRIKDSRIKSKLRRRRRLNQIELKKTANSWLDFNQGDDEIIKILKLYQDAKDGAPLTIDDLKSALGEGADLRLVHRIMRRFDRDGDQTIDIEELETGLLQRDPEIEGEGTKVDEFELLESKISDIEQKIRTINDLLVELIN